jgi:ubiquinone/menaquinone biosynthesis C-methylase UbiE
MNKQINKIKTYYDSHTENEWDRLIRNPLEFPITFKHILDVIPKHKNKILDIGGGPGRYSIELAKLGNEVTLFDLSNENLNYAEKKASEEKVKIKEYVNGNACDLSNFANNTFDLTLLMGPLYHLIDKDQRMKAISESIRVTKKEGYLVFAFISKYAAIYDCIKNKPDNCIFSIDHAIEIFEKQTNMEIIEDIGFTDAYFIDPIEVEEIAKEHNLKIIRIFGAESLIAQSNRKLNLLSSKEKEKWIDLAYRLSITTAGIYGSEHIMNINQKII